MIYYFSATGNSKYVAEQIAAHTGDKAKSIVEAIEKEQYSVTLAKGEQLGIVSPTYYWGMPTITRVFLENLQVKAAGENYIYFVGTYGTTPGVIGADANSYMKQKGYPFDGYYSVMMPDTWTPIFDLSNKEKVARKNEAADKQLEQIMVQIKEQTKGNYMQRKMPYAVRWMSNAVYEKARTTNHFKVEDSCIGCGLCEKKCPVHAISMQDGLPVWKEDKCAMCLGCLHRCPKFAIQYGKKTKAHGQYQHPSMKKGKDTSNR